MRLNNYRQEWLLPPYTMGKNILRNLELHRDRKEQKQMNITEA